MITWSEFPDKFANTRKPQQHTWPELVEYLRAAGPYAGKKAQPLLSLCSYGAKRTAENCLRSAENVQQVFGIEGDYDKEVVPIDTALATLESYGIRAALYPSASFTPDKPRWRVLCPLAAPCLPSERERLVARLNGVLGGILAGESFTLSQSYYFGRINEHWAVTCTFDDPEDGHCIDTLDELDELAILKPNAVQTGSERQPVEVTLFTNKVNELGRKLRDGDGRRDLLKTWIASRSARGLPLGDLMLITRGVVAEFFDPAYPVDWSSIDGMARHFAQRDHKPAVDFSGLLGSVSGGGGVVDPLPPPDAPALVPVPVLDVLTAPSPPPRFVWANYLPRGVVALLGAHGGTGKSTIALMLAVAATTGRPLFGVDTEPARVLFLTLEDSGHVVRHRLAHICREWDIEPEELARLEIFDGTDNPELFATAGRDAGSTTNCYAELCSLAKGADLVIVDNASDAYGGDEIQRRQVRAFIRSLGWIARDNDASVLLLAHVDKNTSRARKAEGGEGYSGSTAWHNSVRSRLFMTREAGGALVLEHQKTNFGRLCEPLRLFWPPDGLPQLDTAPSGVVAYIGDRVSTQALLKLIAEFTDRGENVSSATTSRTNAARLLAGESTFPAGLKPGDVFDLLRRAERAGHLARVVYRGADRKPRECWEVTPQGREYVGLPPAATAATSEFEEVTAPSAAGRGDCGDSARGYGGRSAHTESPQMVGGAEIEESTT